jgi:hypothetical protein
MDRAADDLIEVDRRVVDPERPGISRVGELVAAGCRADRGDADDPRAGRGPDDHGEVRELGCDAHAPDRHQELGVAIVDLASARAAPRIAMLGPVRPTDVLLDMLEGAMAAA